MSSAKLQMRVLVPASPARAVQGRVMHLVEPISFWGGVSPVNASITDPRQPHHGQSIADRVLVIRELRGSSSGSSVLLELIYRHIAPAAIICAAPDAILALGSLVAAEMLWPAPGIFELPVAGQLSIPEDSILLVDSNGSVTFCDQQA